MNTYINQKIQQPIERMLNDPNCKDITWYKIHSEINIVRDNFGWFDEVHEVLLPFYKQYIMASPAFFKEREHGRKARHFMSNLLKDEPEYFFDNFNDIDLVACAENWSKYPEIEKHLDQHFSDMISILLKRGYRPNIQTAKEELCSRLRNREMYGDYKELEMYCILIAHLLVYEKDLPLKVKEEYYTLICRHWGFLKYMYSFMLAHIIGMKHTYFSNVMATLVNSKQYYPYMHIAYRAAQQNLKRLYANGKTDFFAKRPVNEVIDEKITELEQIVKHNVHNMDLIPLCKILFPKKIEELLNQYCPPTYNEIAQGLKKAKGEIAIKEEDYNNLLKRTVKIINSSLSIEEITAAFENYPMELAMKVFNDINGLLVGNDTWTRHAKQIRDSIIQGKKKEETEKLNDVAETLSKAARTTNIYNSFEKGSCHFSSGSSMNGDVTLKDTEIN